MPFSILPPLDIICLDHFVMSSNHEAIWGRKFYSGGLVWENSQCWKKLKAAWDRREEIDGSGLSIPFLLI